MATAELSREQLDWSMADGVTSTTVAITATDVDLCVPFVTARMSNTSSYHEDQHCDFEFITGPNRLQISRTDGDEAITGKAQILEFDADHVVVRDYTFGLASTETTDDVTITSAVVAKSFVQAGWLKTVEFGDWNDDTVTVLQTTTTNVQFERVGSDDAVNGHFWVVTDVSSGGIVFDTETVEIASYEDFDQEGTISSVTEAKTFVIAYQRSTATANRPERISVAHLSGATTIKSERDLDSGTIYCTATAVELLQSGDAVTRNSISITSGNESGTDTITAVDEDRAVVNIPMRLTGCKSDQASPPNSAWSSVEYNSTTVVEVNCMDDGTRLTYYESIQFHEDTTVSVSATPATAAFDAPAVTPSTARSVTATTATAVFDAPAATPSTGPQQVSATPATAVFDAPVATPQAIPTQVSATPATATFDAPAATPQAVPTQVSATPATAAFDAPAATPDTGVLQVTATPATATFDAPAATPSTARSVSATPATATFDAPAATPDTGVLQVSATPATAVFDAPTATPQAVPTQVSATPSTAAFDAPAATPSTARSVVATPATAAFDAPAATPSTARSVSATPATAVFDAPTAVASLAGVVVPGAEIKLAVLVDDLAFAVTVDDGGLQVLVNDSGLPVKIG